MSDDEDDEGPGKSSKNVVEPSEKNVGNNTPYNINSEKQTYIISIGEYDTGEYGFEVSVYVEITEKQINNFSKDRLTTPYTETITTENPPYEQSCFITIGLMIEPDKGIMVMGDTWNTLTDKLTIIYEIYQNKRGLKLENVESEDVKLDDLLSKLPPNIKYIGYGKISDMHTIYGNKK